MTPQYIKITEVGSKFYYKDKAMGILHREDGPAVERVDGSKSWYLNDKLHREDGPAVEWNDGSKFWYLNDKLHREDGPAVEYDNGIKEWYHHGQRLSENQFNRLHNSEKERKIYQFGLGVMNLLSENQLLDSEEQIERIIYAAIDLRLMDYDDTGNLTKL
jgi:hypothetical protein